MKKQLIISMVISFFVVFFSLFSVSSEVTDENKFSKKNEFFKHEFSEDRKQIFLFGSSHVAQINTTHLIEKITQNHPNYDIYNLAIASDKPKDRAKYIDEFIALKPEVIFYGVTFRDFDNKYEENFLPQPQQVLKELEKNDYLNYDYPNPKLTTFQIFRKIMDQNSGDLIKSKFLTNYNTPFRKIPISDSLIKTEDEIKNSKDSERRIAGIKNLNIDPPSKNEQVFYLKKIINRLQENDIDVVVFTNPVHNYYLNSLRNDQKENFDLILIEISEKYEIPIYDFTEKYQNSSIFTDLHHIAFNNDSILFSSDIANMIIQEIER